MSSPICNDSIRLSAYDSSPLSPREDHLQVDSSVDLTTLSRSVCLQTDQHQSKDSEKPANSMKRPEESPATMNPLSLDRDSLLSANASYPDVNEFFHMMKCQPSDMLENEFKPAASIVAVSENSSSHASKGSTQAKSYIQVDSFELNTSIPETTTESLFHDYDARFRSTSELEQHVKSTPSNATLPTHHLLPSDMRTIFAHQNESRYGRAQQEFEYQGSNHGKATRFSATAMQRTHHIPINGNEATPLDHFLRTVTVLEEDIHSQLTYVVKFVHTMFLELRPMNCNSYDFLQPIFSRVARVSLPRFDKHNAAILPYAFEVLRALVAALHRLTLIVIAADEIRTKLISANSHKSIDSQHLLNLLVEDILTETSFPFRTQLAKGVLQSLADTSVQRAKHEFAERNRAKKTLMHLGHVITYDNDLHLRSPRVFWHIVNRCFGSSLSAVRMQLLWFSRIHWDRIPVDTLRLACLVQHFTLISKAPKAPQISKGLNDGFARVYKQLIYMMDTHFSDFVTTIVDYKQKAVQTLISVQQSRGNLTAVETSSQMANPKYNSSVYPANEFSGLTFGDTHRILELYGIAQRCQNVITCVEMTEFSSPPHDFQLIDLFLQLRKKKLFNEIAIIFGRHIRNKLISTALVNSVVDGFLSNDPPQIRLAFDCLCAADPICPCRDPSLFAALILQAVTHHMLDVAKDALEMMQSSKLQLHSITLKSIFRILHRDFSKNADAKTLAMRLVDVAPEDIFTDMFLCNAVINTCIAFEDNDRLIKILDKCNPHILNLSELPIDGFCCGTLIKAFGKRMDIHKVLSIWNTCMSKKEFSPTEYTFGCLLNALIVNGRVDQANKFYNKYFIKTDRYRHHLNAIIYGIMIKGCGKQKKFHLAMKYYDHMQKFNIKCNQITFNTLISACVAAKQIHHAKAIIEDSAVHSPQCKPDVVTYSILIKGFCDKGELKQAYELYVSMIASGLRPDQVVYNTLLEGFAKSAPLKQTEEMYEQFLREGMVPSTFTLTILIRLYGHARCLDKSVYLFNTIPQRHNFEVDVYVYTAIISAALINRQLDLAIQYFDEMVQGKFSNVVNARMYGTIISGCIKHSRLLTAYKYILDAHQRNLLESTTILKRFCSALANAKSLTSVSPAEYPDLSKTMRMKCHETMHEITAAQHSLSSERERISDADSERTFHQK